MNESSVSAYEQEFTASSAVPDLDALMRQVNNQPDLDELIRRAEAPPSVDDAVRRLRSLDRRRRERLIARLDALAELDLLVRETPYGSGWTA